MLHDQAPQCLSNQGTKLHNCSQGLCKYPAQRLGLAVHLIFFILAPDDLGSCQILLGLSYIPVRLQNTHDEAASISEGKSSCPDSDTDRHFYLLYVSLQLLLLLQIPLLLSHIGLTYDVCPTLLQFVSLVSFRA